MFRQIASQQLMTSQVQALKICTNPPKTANIQSLREIILSLKRLSKSKLRAQAKSIKRTSNNLEISGMLMKKIESSKAEIIILLSNSLYQQKRACKR